MKKLKYYIIPLLTMTLYGCVETDIVKKYSAAQVEQLLTAGDIKHWLRTEYIEDGERQPIENCGDSVRWVFEVISADSIASYQLNFNPSCLLYDTTFLGSFRASVFEETVFTDSLLFEGGEVFYMKPRYIRSSTFSVSYEGDGKSYISSFGETRSDYLSRQVAYYLTDGVSPGDSKDWYLSRLFVDGTGRSLQNCGDTLIFRFTKNSETIGLQQLDPDTTCANFTTVEVGTFNLGSEGSEGYFDGGVNFTDGIVSDFEFTAFRPEEFTVEFVAGAASYRMIFKAER